jgi:predicted nucleic acid-binding protein
MILDTNAVSALSFEDADLLAVLASSLRLYLPVIVIGEYEFGLAGSKKSKELKAWFALLVAASIVLAVDRETAAHYGTICSALKRSGKPIPSNELCSTACPSSAGMSISIGLQEFAASGGNRLRSCIKFPLRSLDLCVFSTSWEPSPKSPSPRCRKHP